VQDSNKHKGMRNRLISELRLKDLYADDVLDAMGRIPRHHFIDSSAFLEFAYQDTAFPIGAGQTISHPSTVAFQTTLLNIKKGDKVLEIGTGCGFQTAVLCELKAKVYSIERQRELYDKTKVFLEDKRYNARLFFGDGYKGLPKWAPFDKIIITCGAPEIPKAVLAQLSIGGEMVVPIGGESQTMVYVYKNGSDDFRIEKCGDFSFVPMLPNRNQQ
jgi:protein-L-isoaspartate(D-aspartate) O-methyltransferase